MTFFYFFYIFFLVPAHEQQNASRTIESWPTDDPMATQIFPFNLTICNITVTIKSADCD